jgi:hypothetical protein
MTTLSVILGGATRARRLVLMLLGLVALGIAAAAVASAHWAAQGTGTGSASTGTMTIQVGAIVAADNNGASLVPGGTGDVILRVTNPNTFSVHVTSVTGNGTPTASPTCTTTGVSFVSPTDYTPAQYTLAPGGSSLLLLPGAASMSTLSTSNCQGAIVSIPVSLTVQK